MRDAFGGAFMIKLLIIFIIIYVVFIALALNYAKAFKVKNRVVKYLEDNEIADIGGISARMYTEMDTFFEQEIVGNLNYIPENSSRLCQGDFDYCNHGIKITKIAPSSSERTKLGNYYMVTTMFGWKIPFIDQLLNMTGGNMAGFWTIKGETRAIVRKN